MAKKGKVRIITLECTEARAQGKRRDEKAVDPVLYDHDALAVHAKLIHQPVCDTWRMDHQRARCTVEHAVDSPVEGGVCVMGQYVMNRQKVGACAHACQPRLQQ